MSAALTQPEHGFRSLRDDPGAVEELVEELLLMAEEAREDAAAFFEFVLRDEVKNEPIKVATHQRLILEFVAAFKQCVLLLPFGHSKTFTLAGIALHNLGGDALIRGAIVSNAQAQAEKPVGMCRQYIEASGELSLVFPNLRRTQRQGEPWTTTDLTVDRPFGIRDPSLVARGLDSKTVLGSRWRWGLFDDLLNDENTRTPEQREKVWQKIYKELFTRMDPTADVRRVWTSTAWHPDDMSHRLMKPKKDGGAGWPALVMRADGIIQLRNTEIRDPVTRQVVDYWDSPLIRPADDRPAGDNDAEYRLTEHDPDPEGKVPLWPERWSVEALREQQEELHPALYNQLFLNICRDDSSSLCKQEYIDKALELGRRMGKAGTIPNHLVESVPQGFSYPLFAGVDLAFSTADAADESAIFVMAVYPDPDFQLGALGKSDKKKPNPIRVPLWIEHGKWGADELYKRLQSVDRRFRPYAFAVENNGAQEGVRKLMITGDKTLILKPHTTNATKNTIAMGVPSIFAEMANGAWAFPNKDAASIAPALRTFIDGCLYYSPGEHTNDTLMSAYFARDLAKKYGVLSRATGDAPAGSSGVMLR